jgi:hypothetical protein
VMEEVLPTSDPDALDRSRQPSCQPQIRGGEEGDNESQIRSSECGGASAAWEWHRRVVQHCWSMEPGAGGCDAVKGEENGRLGDLGFKGGYTGA